MAVTSYENALVTDWLFIARENSKQQPHTARKSVKHARRLNIRGFFNRDPKLFRREESRPFTYATLHSFVNLILKIT